MLKEIAIVTITVTNLTQVEEAWEHHFDYQVVERGEVSAELSAHWQAPETTGDAYIIMQAANEPGTYVRFVSDDAVAEYTPMTTTGWNATELLVSDTDAVRAGMTDEHFEVVGEPKNLWPAPDAPRAMQAVGPGGELLYITTNNQAKAGLGLDDTMPLVERPFIMVVGGTSMDDFNAFYGDQLGLKVDPPTPFVITMISKANNLPMDTQYPLAIAYLAPGYLLELDELPADIGARETEDGHLPPGVAMVSFQVDNIPVDFDWYSAPQKLNAFPYNGREVAIIEGPAGELIELITSP